MNKRPSVAHIFDYYTLGDWYSSEEVRRIFDEEEMVRNWLEIEAVLAESQAQLEIIPSWAANQIRSAVSGYEIPLQRLGKEIAEASHALIPVVRELERISGDAGKYVHMGATTQDILDTGLVLQVKRVYETLTRDLVDIIYVLINLAKEHRNTVMIGRTHGIHAIPTTLGFKFAIWIGELLRHLNRFDQSRPRVLVGQLGGGVGTMAGFGPKAKELRKLFMERIGLYEPPIAWQSARDSFGEFVLISALLGATLGKFASEVALLQATEVGELVEPNPASKVGSTTMPHKQNPLQSETVVALGSILQGLASSALGSLRTRGERDFMTWGIELYVVPNTACLLASQLQKILGILDALVINRDRMRQNLGLLSGMACSENLMLKLMPYLGRDKAHELVSDVARRATLNGEDFCELAAADSDITTVLTRDEVLAALQPEAYLGEAAAEVDQMVELALTELESRSSY